MDVPTPKQINSRLSVSVAAYGWPYWTNISIDNANVGLNREEAHDLRHAMERICAYLDARDREDEQRRLR